MGTYADSNSIGSNKYTSFHICRTDNQFFRKPRLCLEHSDTQEQETFAPEHSDGNYTQKYLRIRIRNKGFSSAHNCKGQLRVIIPKGANPRIYPSRDAKDLTWGSSSDKSDISKLLDIHPIIGDALLHVVFSDSSFGTIPIADAPTRYASVSIFDRLRDSDLRVEDSFSIGNFLMEIIVSSDETYCRAKFMIEISNDYRVTNMRKLTRFENFIKVFQDLSERHSALT